MNVQSQEVLQSALADRAEVAASLIRSLDSDADEDADAAWAAEIQRRVESIIYSTFVAIP